jgi:PEP-CTERM motif
MDVSGTSLINGSLHSQDAPDRFGGKTGVFSFGMSPEVCVLGGSCTPASGIIGFTDGLRIDDPSAPGDPLASVSLTGRWVNVVPEPSSGLLILMLCAAIGAVARRRPR